MKRNFVCFILVLVLCTLLCVPAFATAGYTQSNYDNTPIIVTTSQEDFDRVVKEIEQNNKRVEKLWKEALAEAALPENQNVLLGLATPRSNTVNSVNHIHMTPCGVSAKITFSATYELTTNVAGAKVIGKLFDIDAYGTSSGTIVDTRDIQTTRTDAGRTLCANYSCRVGVKLLTEEVRYYTYAYYVEFYAGGTALVYE